MLKKGREEKESETVRAKRKKLENEILSGHHAATPFKTYSRFAYRAVVKEDGWVREGGFPKNTVVWIVEAMENTCANCGHHKEDED